MILLKTEEGKWKVSYLNSYHNHNFKRKVTTNALLSKLHLTDDQLFDQLEAKALFKTKKVYTPTLSFELQRSIEKLWFEFGMKKRNIVSYVNKLRYIEKRHILNHLA